MSVVVVVPSRGRPEAARLTVEAIRETAIRVATSVVLAVDADDPELDGYRRMVDGLHHRLFADRPLLVVLEPEETGDLVRATNTVSLRVAREDPHAIIGNLGDDHRPRTRGWDRAVMESLEDPGIAYGDDGIHGERLPSAPFISAEIVQALGWFALPACRHLYIDDAWRELGNALGRLRYLPDVSIEHLHPAVGKGAWDDGYTRANSELATERDRLAFEGWMANGLAVDAANVQRALEAAA